MSNCKDFIPLGDTTDRCRYEAERSEYHCICAFHGHCVQFTPDTDTCDADSKYKFYTYEPIIIDNMFNNNNLCLIDTILSVGYKNKIEKLFKNFIDDSSLILNIEIVELNPIVVSHIFKVSDFVTFLHRTTAIGIDEYKCTFIGESV